MSYSKEQKIKLLVLYDLLCRKTDEEHALSTEDIISELSKLNIELSRKTLPQDIELLNEYGYEVLSYPSLKLPSKKQAKRDIGLNLHTERTILTKSNIKVCPINALRSV